MRGWPGWSQGGGRAGQLLVPCELGAGRAGGRVLDRLSVSRRSIYRAQVCVQTVPVPGTRFGADQEAGTAAVISHLFAARSECSFLRSRGSQTRRWFTVVLGVQRLLELVCSRAVASPERLPKLSGPAPQAAGTPLLLSGRGAG